MAKFEVGQIVQHILQKEWVLVLEYKNYAKNGIPQVTCRTKKFTLCDFYEFELEVAFPNPKVQRQVSYP